MSITEELFKLQDLGYRDFQAKLMPTIDKKRIIGVRTPNLRTLAKRFAKTDEAKAFVKHLPHQYYEENNLHAFVICQTKDFDEAVRLTNLFLPHIDNWATCDSFRPNVFGKHTTELIGHIKVWIESKHTYTVRFAIEMLMNFYLDDLFKPEYAEMVAKVKSDEYYVNMMIAWYFATALAKQYDAVIGYITGNRLDVWCHNKTIQKAIESFRISNGQKDFLRGFRRIQN